MTIKRELKQALFEPDGTTNTKMTFTFTDGTVETGYLDNVSMRAILKNSLQHGTFASAGFKGF